MILAVVVANAVIGFVQEGKAEKAMDSIRQMLAPHASVLRDGERQSVAGEDLVPGDIVLLEAGDKVPADLRLIRVHGLQIQEAILTGESVPVDKATSAVDEAAALGDRSCMAFSGTLVTGGQGRGLVVATGASSEIGRISGLLANVETLTTPLVLQMDVFAKWLTVLILLIAGALLLSGISSTGTNSPDMFHGGGRPLGRGHSRRIAGGADDHARGRRPGHGQAPTPSCAGCPPSRRWDRCR